MIQFFCWLIMGHKYEILSKEFTKNSIDSRYTPCVNLTHEEKMIYFGYTTFLKKCNTCGRIETKIFTGKY